MANSFDMDRTRGMYQKFLVKRRDASSGPGGKHEKCEYFVLDLNHDPHAIPALIAYADACEMDFPNLASDLRTKINQMIGRHATG